MPYLKTRQPEWYP